MFFHKFIHPPKEANRINRINEFLIAGGVSTCLILPSVYTIQKHIGNGATCIFVTTGLIVAFFLCMTRMKIVLTTISKRMSLVLSVCIFTVLIVLFALIYPYADSGTIGGGSDRDDALNVAATELVNQRYPYSQSTYLGNPITPFPGAVILSLPFFLLGNSAYQNLFWIAVGYLAAWKFLNDSRLALIFLIAITLTPVSLQQLVTGGDLVTNALYVFVPIVMLLNITSGNSHRLKFSIPFAILLGISISSRSNYLLLFPLILGLSLYSRHWKASLVYFAIPLSTFMAITLPFYMSNPEHFSPLHTISKFSQMNEVLPLGTIIVPTSCLIITLLLVRGNKECSSIKFFRDVSVSQGYLVLLTGILLSIQSAVLDITVSEFGIVCLCFGVIGYLKYVCIQNTVTPAGTS